MRDKGMSHQEIADAISEMTGYPVKRSSVSSALHRAGLTEPLKRYEDELPWDIEYRHQQRYAARMLRLLGRRRRGLAVSAANEKRLDDWLARLQRDGTVVVYVPESGDGFYYIPGEWDAPEVPVMKDFPPAS